MKMRTFTCSVCGQAFETIQKRKRTCSPECLKGSYVGRQEHTMKRAEYPCQYCGKAFTARTCRNRKYCSKECTDKGTARSRTGKIRTSRSVPCDYCGEPVKRYKSRETRKHAFCSTECYHNWDSWYKRQPEQQRRHIKWMSSLSHRTSKIEDDVANWLDGHGIAYTRQSKAAHWSMDFQVGGAYIEIQGCYWHGCYQCFILQTPRQQRVITNDKRKATYCRRRNIPLYIIWEHDIRAGNFSALEPLIASAAAPDTDSHSRGSDR